MARREHWLIGERGNPNCRRTTSRRAVAGAGLTPDRCGEFRAHVSTTSNRAGAAPCRSPHDPWTTPEPATETAHLDPVTAALTPETDPRPPPRGKPGWQSNRRHDKRHSTRPACHRPPAEPDTQTPHRDPATTALTPSRPALRARAAINRCHYKPHPRDPHARPNPTPGSATPPQRLSPIRDLPGEPVTTARSRPVRPAHVASPTHNRAHVVTGTAPIRPVPNPMADVAPGLRPSRLRGSGHCRDPTDRSWGAARLSRSPPGPAAVCRPYRGGARRTSRSPADD